MNIIAVDDERPALWTLEQAIKQYNKNFSVICFDSARDALNYAKEYQVDIAFLDIEMDEMNGLFLAKHLKEIYAQTNIIFVTGYSSYMGNAFDIHASGYVMKPINPERVAAELQNLRNPIKLPDFKISIQCFGNFEIFVDGIPIPFKRSKSKEALAYLTDRKGAGVSKKELASILLEDKQYTRSVQSYIHVIITEMIHSLKEVNAEHIIIKKHNLYAVDPSSLYCDFYSYEKGEISAINKYHGEYMSNYSWAEFTTGKLIENTTYHQ